MNKTKKIWVIIASILLPVVVAVGCIIGAIVANGDKDDVKNLTFDELMFTLNNQISSSSDLTNAIDDMQSMINKSGYQISLLTYQINGQINKAEVIPNGTQVTLINCNDTEKTYFNGWRINGVGQSFNPNQVYTVQQSTNFVANMVNKAVVTFMVDGQVSNTEYCIPGNSTSLPQLNDTDTHYFNGWKVNGQLVTNSNYTIWQDITFVADMAKKAVITYLVNDEVWKTEYAVPNTMVDLPTVPSADTAFYAGWKVNGTGTAYVNYYIQRDVTFVVAFSNTGWAKTQDYEVPFFRGSHIWTDGDNIYYSDRSYQYVLDVETRIWSEKVWNVDFSIESIWTDGENTYLFNDYVLNEETSTWEAIEMNYVKRFSTSNIWTDGKNTYHSLEEDHYILKENNTWELITWNGLKSFNGNCIWTDGTNYYYSSGSNHYILKENNTWEPITWNGLTSFSGVFIWTDGTNTYYSDVNRQYILKENNTWEAISWNCGFPLDQDNIWTDGNDIYYSDGYTETRYVNLKLNPATNTWEQVLFKGIYVAKLSNECMWTDGVNNYYSNGCINLVANKNTRQWELITWEGFNKIYGKNVWTNGTNTYYSNHSDQYILKENNTWEAISWNGLKEFYGEYIWTDGTNTYYSNYNSQYILKENNTWESITWNGLTSFYCNDIWTDGENIYYYGAYILNKETSTWENLEWNIDEEDIWLARFSEVWTDGEDFYLGCEYVLDMETKSVLKKVWYGVSDSYFYFKNLWTDGINIYVYDGDAVYKLVK